MAQSETMRFTVTPEGFRGLAAATAGFERNQARLLRTNIRSAAMTLVNDIRSTLTGGTFTTDAGMRAGIAAGLKVQDSTDAMRPGVQIVASGAQMPAKKAAMVKAWQKATFRHPVFGNPDVLATQAGHPYFDNVITAGQAKVTTAVTRAMSEAADQLAKGHA